MPKLSIWNSGRKGNDYRFLDRTIAEYFSIGGTAVFVHKYLGTWDADGQPNLDGELNIQDMLFLENRDRRYAEDVIELRGIYNVQDSEFDLKQFGLFLANDDLFIEFHMNDMIQQIGRKLMNGDVLELPHLRDDALLDESKPAANKYYVVTDANRASDGYSQTWFSHIWRVKVTPLTDSQEYEDITRKPVNDIFGLTTTDNLIDILGTISREKEINVAVVEEAKEHVKARNFETRQFYVVPGDELTSQNPWVFAGDGDPPNGAALTGSGNAFPLLPTEGDYFLRTDYEPAVLFKRDATTWVRQELDLRKQDWSMAHRLLETFINNNSTATHDDGTVANEKQPLSKAVKPKTDF